MSFWGKMSPTSSPLWTTPWLCRADIAQEISYAVQQMALIQGGLLCCGPPSRNIPRSIASCMLPRPPPLTTFELLFILMRPGHDQHSGSPSKKLVLILVTFDALNFKNSTRRQLSRLFHIGNVQHLWDCLTDVRQYVQLHE